MTERRAPAVRPARRVVRARRALLALALALPATAGRPARALTDEEIYGALRFPLSLPGARASAMGGAGLALTSDATASRINPARLGVLTAPEILLEGRDLRADDRSGASGLVLFDRSVHPFAGSSTASRESDAGVASASFLSYAHPLPVRRPFVVAVALSRPLDLGVDVRSVTRTTPSSAPATPSGGDEVTRISRGRLDVDLDLYHVAAGWRPTPTFAVGGALVVGRLSLSAESVGLLADPLQFTGPGMSDPRFSSVKPAPLFETFSEGADTALGFAFGSWWKPLPSLAVATVYRRGARFEIPGRSRDRSTGARAGFINIVKEPDTAAAGIAWTPFLSHPSATVQSLTVALDLERVETSDITEGLREQEGILTRPDVVRKVSYDVDDSLEVRAGVEARRSFLTWTLAMRGGFYSDHDERLRLTGITDVAGGPLEGQGRALEEGGFLLPDGGVDWHATLGAGADFYALSVDLALDLTGDATRVVLTGGWRLKE